MSGHVVCGQKSVLNTFLTGEVVTRSCEVACSEGGAGFGNVANSNNYCCQQNLCNGAVKPVNQIQAVVALLVSIVNIIITAYLL